ncbi:MAG TPA: hypothetical protein VGH20_14030 [Myxococcales bacterium]
MGVADAGAPSDGGTALAGCDGIVPAALGTSVTAQLPSSDGDLCTEATADESGNVAAALRRASGVGNLFDWHIFSPAGEHQGVAPEILGDVFPQGTGFEAIKFLDLGPASSPFFVRIAPDGSLSKQQLVGSDDTGQVSFRAWPDGLLVLTLHCISSPGSTTIRRFADDGTLIATGTTNNPGPAGCDVAGAANGPGGVTLIVFHSDPGQPDDALQARWFDAAGTAMTDFFTVGVSAGNLVLRALVDGNVAIQASGHWLGLVAPGATTLTPAPTWLADGHDLSIVRGERAYALIPEAGALNHLDLVTAQGQLCGSVTFPGVGPLRTGADGTVIGASGDGGCTKTFWPGLLE